MIEDHYVPLIADITGLQSLNPSPEDVFILSRITGTITVKQIIQMVGFPREKVIACLEKLENQKIITFKDVDVEKKKISSSTPPNIIHVLDEEDKNPTLAQIPRSFRNRIRLLSENLEEKNFFDILEVTPSSTSDEVHENYLRLVKDFHPDRVRLAHESTEYKSKLEKIFEKIQEAYQEIKTDGLRATYIHTLMEKKRGKPDPHDKKPAYTYKVPRKNTEPHFANAESQFKMGQKEENRGNLQGALNFYRMASALKPDEKPIEEAIARVKKLMYKT